MTYSKSSNRETEREGEGLRRTAIYIHTYSVYREWQRRYEREGVRVMRMKERHAIAS